MISLSKEPSGRVMNEVWNEGTTFPHVKYYYGEADESMFKDFVFIYLILHLVNTAYTCRYRSKHFLRWLTS